MLRIRFGDVTLHSLTSHGYLITPGGFTGWDGGVELAGEAVPRPSTHGAFDTPRYLDGRTVSIKGAVLAGSNPELRQMSKVLASVGADGSRFRVVVDEGDESTWAWARMLFAPRPEPIVGGGDEAEFEMQLWCPDPRKYGPVQESTSTGALAEAFNRGNFFSRSRFLVTGSMPAGYRLEGRGQQFMVPGPLSAGQEDYVDFATGTVRRNGVLVPGVTPNLWPVNGGETVEWKLTPLSGAGSATCFVTATYI